MIFALAPASQPDSQARVNINAARAHCIYTGQPQLIQPLDRRWSFTHADPK